MSSLTPEVDPQKTPTVFPVMKAPGAERRQGLFVYWGLAKLASIFWYRVSAVNGFTMY